MWDVCGMRVDVSAMMDVILDGRIKFEKIINEYYVLCTATSQQYVLLNSMGLPDIIGAPPFGHNFNSFWSSIE